MFVSKGFGTPQQIETEEPKSTSLSTASVTAKSAAFATKAKEFAAAYSAALPSQKPALLRGQTIGKELDDFVIAVSNGEIELPTSVKATDVIGPAVAEFIKLGIPYSVDTPGVFGGSHYAASSLDKDGNPAWQSWTAK